MPQNFNELKIRVPDASESLDMHMLSSVWNEIFIVLACVDSPMGLTFKSDK
jgi:hypothetical protein